MKKIGFVDYYISEWHANNYPVWINEICEQNGWDYKVAYAWAELDTSLVDNRTTEEWCKEYGVTKCDTIDELCEKSDYIIVLSPSNPEKHLEYAEKVLKYRKNTYIDKTFAPDYATAEKIFELGKKYNTKFFSTSALRCSTETDGIKGCNSAVLTGCGGNFDEYIIHQIEMAVKIMGLGAKRIKTENQAGDTHICRIDYGNGKYATINYTETIPFAVAHCCEDGKNGYSVISSDYFKILLKHILEFFESGEVFFDVNETLEVIKIREKLIDGKGKEGVWLNL